MNRLTFITTGDGSHTLMRVDLDETYHSIHGAVQESNHVFINNGLRYWLRNVGRRQINLFEVGFGTGLNAWLTHRLAREEDLQIRYVTIEAHPLQREVWTQLNYSPGDASFTRLHDAPWNEPIMIDDHFSIHKVEGKLEDYDVPQHTDIVYFDAFAPARQPELWTYPILERVCDSLATNGVFVTYCAKGQLKRDLRKLGLRVETLAGPPGKKEMVRAVRS